MKQKIILSFILALIISSLCACVFKNDVTLEAEKSAATEHKILRVVDGDTFVADINGEKTTVRMIGIDTPESVHNDDSRNSKFGEVSSEFTKKMLNGKNVELEYDTNRTDQYGRILAYVYLNGEMVNEILVEEGYAVAKEYPPNTKYSEVFSAAQEDAEARKVGMWAENISNSDTGGLKSAA